MKKVVFLDKDGTLVQDVPFNVDPHKIVCCDGVEKGLLMLRNRGYAFVIVSNQEGLARGYFSEKDLGAVISYMHGYFSQLKASLLGFYYCPHRTIELGGERKVVCGCRKPRPGLLRQAAEQHGIDLSASWMIGDILNDIEAAHRAGCKGILLNNGNETEWDLEYPRIPEGTATTFDEAAYLICSYRSSVEENLALPY